MSTPAVAAGAAALGFYVWLRQWQQCGYSSVVDLPLLPETHARTEAPPTTWSETLYLFKEAFRYMYQETFARWHAIDLFFGLAYLSRKPTVEYPASDIAAAGQPISGQQLSATEAQQLHQELQEVRRYMLYCQGLRHHRLEQQKKHWHDLLGLGDADIIKHNPAAGLLRPAYVIVKDHIIGAIILCVRGTHSRPDMFTSLTGTVKPHHVVTADGVVLGYSHLGMLAAARWLMSSVKGTLIEALQDNPGYSLKVVGHSMGGGTAAMLTMMFRDKVPELSSAICWAIACPACMTLQLARSCAPCVTTLIHGTDIVPTFSAGAIDRLRQEVTESSWFVEFQSDIRQRLATNFVSSLKGLRQGAAGTAQWTHRNIIATAATSLSACYSRAPGYRPLRTAPSVTRSSTGTSAAAAAAARSQSKPQPAAAAAAAGLSNGVRGTFGFSRRLPGRARISRTGSAAAAAAGSKAGSRSIFLDANGASIVHKSRSELQHGDEIALRNHGAAVDDSGDGSAAQNRQVIPERSSLLGRVTGASWFEKFSNFGSSRRATAAAAAASIHSSSSNRPEAQQLPAGTQGPGVQADPVISEAMLIERALEACLSAVDAGHLDNALDSSTGCSGNRDHALLGDATTHVSAAAAGSAGRPAAAASGSSSSSSHKGPAAAAGNFMRGVSRAVLGKRPAAPNKKDDDDDRLHSHGSKQGLAVESAAAAAAEAPSGSNGVSSSSVKQQQGSLRHRGWGWDGVLGVPGRGWVTDESGNISNGVISGSRNMVQYIGQTVGYTGKAVLQTTGQLIRGGMVFQGCASPGEVAAAAAAGAAAAAAEANPDQGHRSRPHRRQKQQHDSTNSVMAPPGSSSDLMRMDRDGDSDWPDPSIAAAARLASSNGSGSSSDDETLDDDSDSDPDLLDNEAAFGNTSEGLGALSHPALEASISALMAAASTTDPDNEGMYSQAHRQEEVAAERLIRETSGHSIGHLANMGATAAAPEADMHGVEQQQQQQQQQVGDDEPPTGLPLDPDEQQQHGEDAAAAADRAAERRARRLMYPAGRILHLMPASVVAAAAAAAQQDLAGDAAHTDLDPIDEQDLQSTAAPVSPHSPKPGQSPRSLPPLNAATGSVGLGDDYVLLQVDNAEVYGRMRLCPAMVRDHFIPSYLRALDSVMGQLERLRSETGAADGSERVEDMLVD